MERPRGSKPAIDSPANPTIRKLRDLHEAAGQEIHGAFLIEGTRLVGEAMRADWPLIVALFDERRAIQDRALARLVEQIPTAIPVTARALRHAAETVTPQGIVAAARLPRLCAEVDSSEALVLVLDRVSDPGNAGTLLRSALGAGVQTVLALSGCVDLFSPKVVRAGMGAHFYLTLGTNLTWSEAAQMMGADRVVVVAETPAEMPYYRYDWRSKAALVVGSEASGVSGDVLSAARDRVAIPVDPRLESLNAAVAGSLIMFEAKRQRDEETTSG